MWPKNVSFRHQNLFASGIAQLSCSIAHVYKEAGVSIYPNRCIKKRYFYVWKVVLFNKPLLKLLNAFSKFNVGQFSLLPKFWLELSVYILERHAFHKVAIFIKHSPLLLVSGIGTVKDHTDQKCQILLEIWLSSYKYKVKIRKRGEIVIFI